MFTQMIGIKLFFWRN